jgi:hypothetical protein
VLFLNNGIDLISILKGFVLRYHIDTKITRDDG